MDLIPDPAEYQPTDADEAWLSKLEKELADLGAVKDFGGSDVSSNSGLRRPGAVFDGSIRPPTEDIDNGPKHESGDHPKDSDGDHGGLDFPSDSEASSVTPGRVEPDTRLKSEGKKRHAQPETPRPEAADVEPDTRTKKRKAVEPDTHRHKSNKRGDLRPPTIPGHKWKASGYTGFELYTRRASKSASGKRSSKGDYVAYYSRQDMEDFINERKKTANIRPAKGGRRGTVRP